MRSALVALVLLLGCGDEPTPAPPAAPPPAPETSSPAPVPTPSAPVADPAAGAPRIDGEVAREVTRHVREARVAEHAGDHDAALAAFDAALRLVPSQPRILCEAGFVAHRAGDSDAAARRIETALRVFGPPAQIGASLRVPLAMCLYNAGLVEEARGEPALAVERFEASLALRPNDTVTAARERARAARELVDEETPFELVGGVRLDGGELLATSEAELVTALRAGFAGYDDFSAAWVEPESTEVEVLARPSGAAEVVVVGVDSPSYPLSSEHLVVALRTERGWRVTAIETGGADQTDHGVWGGGERGELTASWSGPILRIDYESSGNQGFMTVVEGATDDASCWEMESSEGSSEHVALCRIAPTFQCVTVTTRVREREGARVVECETGEPAADVEPPREAGPEIEDRAEIRMDGNGIVVASIVGPGAEDALGLSVRAYAWDELVADHGFHAIRLATDADRAETDDEPAD